MVFCCLLIKWSSYVQYGTVVLSPLFNLFFNYLHVTLIYIILHYTTRVSIRVQVYGDGDGVDSKLIFDLLTRLLARLYGTRMSPSRLPRGMLLYLPFLERSSWIRYTPIVHSSPSIVYESGKAFDLAVCAQKNIMRPATGLLSLLLCGLLSQALSHDPSLQVNPEIGVPGFPHCRRKNPHILMAVEEAAQDLKCMQQGTDDAIQIGTVGDSITAGVHSSGGNHTYPGQLQIYLDEKYGKGKYAVTNLGACGSTMLKKGNSPYWQRPQYTTLIQNTWDIVIIMLGTNDSKDVGDHGPNNWHEEDNNVHGEFAQNYRSLIDIIRKLGKRGNEPVIFAAIPPPLMEKSVYGMNQTVINSVFPYLVKDIVRTNPGVKGPIDVYSGLGGAPDWKKKFPSSCTTMNHNAWASCEWYCDAQSCDQCHPNDEGYHHMAKVFQDGMGL